METRLNLDVVAAGIRERVPNWEGRGQEVGPITWRDGGSRELTVDRTDVLEPDSVGVLVRTNGQEGQLVMYRGGWAEISFCDSEKNDEVIEVIGWEDWITLDAVGSVVDRFGCLFP
jgi:hypothetical protein